MRWPLRRKRSWTHLYEEGWEAGTRGDIEKAIGLFAEAARLAPEEPTPHYQLGFSYLLQKRYSDALVPFRVVEQLSPGYFIVQTYIYLCEQALAEAPCGRCVEELTALQQLVDAGQSEDPEAVAFAERLVEAAPSCALAQYHLGKALFHLNRARSEAALRRCVELAPDDTTIIDALTHIGFHREADGDLAGARSAWAEVLNRYASNPHANLTRLVFAQRFGTA